MQREERGSKNEARVVELFLFVLLLLAIAAVLSGRIGFTGEWGTVGGVGHAGTAMRPAFSLPIFRYRPVRKAAPANAASSLATCDARSRLRYKARAWISAPPNPQGRSCREPSERRR